MLEDMSEEPRERSTFDLVSWPAELLAIPVFGVILVGLALCATFVGAMLGEAVGLHARDAGLVMMFVAFIAAIATLLSRYSPVSKRILDYRLELWPRGLAYGSRKSLRFVPYARIREIEQNANELRLLLVDGTCVKLTPAAQQREVEPLEVEPARACAAIAELLEEEIARERSNVTARGRTRPADFDATVALLTRRGRPVTEWHAELATLSGNGDGARYRVATLRDDTLVRIANDTEVDDDARDAAQRVLDARRA